MMGKKAEERLEEIMENLKDSGFIPHTCAYCQIIFFEVPDVRDFCENCRDEHNKHKEEVND